MADGMLTTALRTIHKAPVGRTVHPVEDCVWFSFPKYRRKSGGCPPFKGHFDLT